MRTVTVPVSEMRVGMQSDTTKEKLSFFGALNELACVELVNGVYLCVHASYTQLVHGARRTHFFGKLPCFAIHWSGQLEHGSRRAFRLRSAHIVSMGIATQGIADNAQQLRDAFWQDA